MINKPTFHIPATAASRRFRELLDIPFSRFRVVSMVDHGKLKGYKIEGDTPQATRWFVDFYDIEKVAKKLIKKGKL